MLKLHVTTKYLFWRKGSLWNVGEDDRKRKHRRSISLGSRCNIGEIKHCQSMKGGFPRDCLISAYLHLLATHSYGRADAEVYGHTGRSSINHLWENISAGIPSKISRLTWSSICSVGAGLCGISSFFLMNLMVILCLNIYPQFIVSGIQTL